MTPLPILLYHSVGWTDAPAYRRWCIDPERFDEHLAAIDQAGFDCLTLSGLVRAIDEDTLPERPLVITFDDGRADFVEHAVPRLARYGLPSTMYVVSANVGGTSAWLGIPGESDQPMMTWDDLRDVVELGHEIGAHSATHAELDVVRHHWLSSEIAGSRHELEAGLGARVRSFAYPHGYHSAHVVALTKAAGFDSACAVNDEWSWVGESRFALSRLIVDGDTTADQLLARLAAPPSSPRRRSRILRAGWRGVRWARERRPIGAPT